MTRAWSPSEHIRSHWLPVSILFAFALMLLWPLLRGALYWGDIEFYFQPMWDFARQELRAGRVPLWNGRVLLGQPLLGNPQMGVFYPASLLFTLLPTWAALNAASVLHVFGCGLFMYAYLLRWTRGRTAPLVGAMAYMGSECLVARVQFPPMLYTAAYFPLLLWRLDRCLDDRRLQNYCWLAAAIGLMLLAGHAQFAYFILVCGMGYTLGRCWQQQVKMGARWRVWRERVIPLVASGVVGVMLAAVQVLPTLQLLARSPRERLTPFDANRFVLDGPLLLSALWPRCFGHPASRDFWWRGNAWEPTLFVGWLPLLLAGVALRFRFRSRFVRFWLAGGVIALWLAFGLQGGLFWLAFRTLPGLANFHDPARFLLITVFAAAVLAAVGVEAWRAHFGGLRRWQNVMLVCGTMVPLVWYAGDWNPTTNPRVLDSVPRVAQHLLQGQTAGRTYLPQHDYFVHRVISDGYSDSGETDPASVQTGRETLIPNLGMQWGVESASGYEPVPVAAATMLDGLGRMALLHGQPNLAAIMTVTDARFLLLPDTLRLSLPGFQRGNEQARHTRQKRWQNKSGLGRAWIVPYARHVEGAARIAAALASPDFNLGQEAIASDVNAESVLLLPERLSSSEQGLSSGKVKVQPIRDGEYQMQTESLSAPGLLLLSSTAYPGWQATVDGRRAALCRANGVMLGVFLTAGAHTVRLKYAPEMYRVGLYVTLASLGLMAGAAGWSGMQRRAERMSGVQR